MACLAYSTKFAQIVESMGKNRTRVQDLFSKHFLDPFIGDSSKKKGAMDNSLVHFVQALFPNLVDAVKMVFAYGMEKKVNFNKVVAGILEATGINEGTRTDAPVADWALGKTWLVGATVSANAYLWEMDPKNFLTLQSFQMVRVYLPRDITLQGTPSGLA